MTAPLFQEATTPAEPVAPPAEEAPDALAPDENAPYGYTIDPGTKERRPKLRPGRQRKDAPPKPPAGVSPSLEELKALKDAETKKTRREDVAPQEVKKTSGSGLKAAAAKMTAESDKPFRAGPIAKGMNKAYRKCGKIVKLWHPQIGKALILCTVKDDEDDTTVGEAWEELARINPRIRGFVERLIQGGAWSSLFWAHMPFFLAILMTDTLQNRMPLANMLVGLMADQDGDEDDDDQAAAAGPLANLMGDLGPQDMAQMMQMVQGMMAGATANMPRPPQAPAREAAA